MTVIVQDSFNRANSTTTLGNADTGQTWIGTGWGISNNQAYRPTSAALSNAILESGVSDGYVAITMSTKTGTNNSGLVFRYTDESNYWRVVHQGNNNTTYLQKCVSGSFSTVGSFVITIADNTVFKVKLTGSSIEVFLNDVSYLLKTDAFNTLATKHGLQIHSNTVTRFDDFLVEDFNTGGGTEPVGTDGSVTLGLMQQIYADTSANLNLIQAIYKDTETLLPLTQSIYQESEKSLNLRQEIYAEAESILNLIQEFYEDSQTYITLQLIQQIYKDSSTDLTLTQAIYRDNEIGLPLRQEMYEEKVNILSLTQNVYKDDTNVLNLSQTIYRDSQQTLNLIQQMYTEGEISLPLLIQIRDDLVNLIGTIRLIGKRVLNIPLQGKRELNVTLLGGIDVTAINQNFSMIAGDTKNLNVTLPEDVTGCTVKWGLRQRVHSTENILTKSTSDGITVNGTDITIKLAPVDTLSLAGTYYHECEVTDQLNNVSTIFTGMATISKSGV